MALGSIKATIKKYPVGTAAIAVTVLMLAALFVRHSSLTELRDGVAEKAEESDKLTHNISYASQLDEQLRELQDSNRLIAGRLVNPQDLAINLQYFYKLEAETGVKLLDTRPVSAGAGAKITPTKGGYIPVQYAVSLQGGYAKVLSFLRRLEQGSIYCRVVTANCTRTQSEQSGSQDKTSDEIVLSLTVEILGKA